MMFITTDIYLVCMQIPRVDTLYSWVGIWRLRKGGSWPKFASSGLRQNIEIHHPASAENSDLQKWVSIIYVKQCHAHSLKRKPWCRIEIKADHK